MSNRTSAFIKRAEKFLLKSGVIINFECANRLDEDEVYITWFERINSNSGDGAKALTTVCEYADEMSIVLSLCSPTSLISYYEDFGFVQDGPGNSKNVNMYRYYST